MASRTRLGGQVRNLRVWSGRGWGQIKPSLRLQVGPLQTGTLTRVHSIPLNAIVGVTAETAGAAMDDSEITLTYISTPRMRAHSVAYGSYTFEFPRNFDIAGLYRYFQQIATGNVAKLNEA